MFTAIERDALWLIDEGFPDIDIDQFSDWVCRNMADGQEEEKARITVLEVMRHDLKRTSKRPSE